MSTYDTEQVEFWAGEFGDAYTERSQGEKFVSANTALFSTILSKTSPISSVIEFGANIGLNLIAIKRLLPDVEISAVEINESAVKKLDEIPWMKTYPTSILKFEPDSKRDLVLVKGLLIHINPDELPRVYDLMYQTCGRYICIVEYYNPSPVEISYRGHERKLFKRDFAGELMDKYDDLTLIDYGFAYHRDQNFPQDDVTWFLLAKNGR